MSTQNPKYTVGRIVGKLFPFEPELSIPLAVITPILAVCAKKLLWLLALPLGVWVCRCGDEYFFFGERCIILDADGIAHPYMVFKNKKERWVPDANMEVIDTNVIQAEFIRKQQEQQEDEKQ